MLVPVGMDEGGAPRSSVLPTVSGPSVLPAERHRIGVTEAGSPSSGTLQSSLSARTYGKGSGVWSRCYSKKQSMKCFKCR